MLCANLIHNFGALVLHTEDPVWFPYKGGEDPEEEEEEDSFRGANHVVVVSYIVDHVCLMCARGVVHVSVVSDLVNHYF